MIEKNWKRFSYFDKGLAALFIINIFLNVFNDKILKSLIPLEIISYSFWLSLGLYLGFQLCKYEYKRAMNIKKQNHMNN